jgi:hypothetical protein
MIHAKNQTLRAKFAWTNPFYWCKRWRNLSRFGVSLSSYHLGANRQPWRCMIQYSARDRKTKHRFHVAHLCAGIRLWLVAQAWWCRYAQTSMSSDAIYDTSLLWRACLDMGNCVKLCIMRCCWFGCFTASLSKNMGVDPRRYAWCCSSLW